MNPRILIRPQAGRDLDELADYIAQHDGVSAAVRFYRAAEEMFRLIAVHPAMGSTRTFRDPVFQGVRMCPIRGFRKHLVFYRPIEKWN